MDRAMDERATLIVLAKHAADPATVVVDPVDGRVDPVRLTFGPDPASLLATAWALAARDHLTALGRLARVVAVIAGPPDADATARFILALGADAVIRADLAMRHHNPLATAGALAQAAGIDRSLLAVVAGAASVDRSSGMVPPAFAEIAGLPFAGDAVLESPARALGDGTIHMIRHDAVGRRVACACPLPAVIAIRMADSLVPTVHLEARLTSLRATIPVVRIAGVDRFAIPQATCPPRRPARLRPAPEGRLPEDRVASLMTVGAQRRSGRVVQGPPATLVEAALQFLVQEGFITAPAEPAGQTEAGP
jgi:electron transfer flavoprotein alpha/beta subunit